MFRGASPLQSFTRKGRPPRSVGGGLRAFGWESAVTIRVNYPASPRREVSVQARHLGDLCMM